MTVVRSIRSFIGAADYEQSRRFYHELGFEVSIISPKMCYISIDQDIGFYLQDYFVKDWINNSMLFLEVEDLDDYYRTLDAKQLPQKYQ